MPRKKRKQGNVYRVKTIFRREHFHTVRAASEEDAKHEAYLLACEETASEVIWEDSEAELVDGEREIDN